MGFVSLCFSSGLMRTAHQVALSSWRSLAFIGLEPWDMPMLSEYAAARVTATLSVREVARVLGMGHMLAVMRGRQVGSPLVTGAQACACWRMDGWMDGWIEGVGASVVHHA